jgi:hypothetical protein
VTSLRVGFLLGHKTGVRSRSSEIFTGGRPADTNKARPGGVVFPTGRAVWFAWRRSPPVTTTAPVSREMILNYIGEHVLGLPKSY